MRERERGCTAGRVGGELELFGRLHRRSATARSIEEEEFLLLLHVLRFALTSRQLQQREPERRNVRHGGRAFVCGVRELVFSQALSLSKQRGEENNRVPSVVPSKRLPRLHSSFPLLRKLPLNGRARLGRRRLPRVRGHACDDGRGPLCDEGHVARSGGAEER